ncbi:DUF5776 domain-containing protein [Lentilactobacillus sp. SPB1-3]|uniref:DUF5776 domain-containing protein n=1 Tax=Lentilactobacillus terminaliae TaxID=3003483 RepID=A0ACD5DC99_9LACO|nr:DUF5776 domain-containing protein [Lentilactobacillus sp. SPB1-3]MCZ0977145.1 DUF5776 domain-containing protein [Lentilactobacillus sp. SPB1-3]
MKSTIKKVLVSLSLSLSILSVVAINTFADDTNPANNLATSEDKALLFNKNKDGYNDTSNFDNTKFAMQLQSSANPQNIIDDGVTENDFNINKYDPMGTANLLNISHTLVDPNRFHDGKGYLNIMLKSYSEKDVDRILDIQFGGDLSYLVPGIKTNPKMLLTSESVEYLQNIERNNDGKISIYMTSKDPFDTQNFSESDLNDSINVNNITDLGDASKFSNIIVVMRDIQKDDPVQLVLPIDITFDQSKYSNTDLLSLLPGENLEEFENLTNYDTSSMAFLQATLLYFNNVGYGRNPAGNDQFFSTFNPKKLLVSQPKVTISEGQSNFDPDKSFEVDPDDADYVITNDKNAIVFDSTKQDKSDLQKLTGGSYTITFSKPGYSDGTGNLTIKTNQTSNPGNGGNNNSGGGSATNPTQPSTPSQPVQPSTPVQPSRPVLPTPSVPGNNSTGLPNWAAVKGQSVYGIKGLYLYSDTNFYTNERIKHYAKTSRVNRPQFIVKGYNYDDNGKLRYKVQQYNPYKGKYVAGTKGYITANDKYVVKAYYATTPKNKRIKVINKNGVKSYRNVKLSGKAKLYKKGSTLKVKSIKKYKLATRYQLTNGQYVTGNKKFIIWK